jgi:hypothetical protein
MTQQETGNYTSVHGFQYAKDLRHFMILCVSCHRKYDTRPDTRLKMSNTRRGVPNTTASRRIIAVKDGIEIASFDSIKQAAIITGILRTALVNNLKKHSHTAGGYEWKYSKT